MVSNHYEPLRVCRERSHHVCLVDLGGFFQKHVSEVKLAQQRSANEGVGISFMYMCMDFTRMQLGKRPYIMHMQNELAPHRRD
jgi:hypothetical protein